MKKWIVKILAVMAIAAIMVGIHPDIDAHAKTKHTVMVSGDWQGNIYIEKDGKQMCGWFKIGNKTYYGHKTKSYSYPKGSLCTRAYRVNNGKMYYFDENGVMVTKDTAKMPHVSFNKDGSVHYIYAPGMIRRYRYNANRKRYQYLTDNGKWVDDGMQCYPEGMIDWQE